jgi:hypothetical protein
MTLDEVKCKTSVSEFALWMEFLDREDYSFPERYYLAMIAAEVRRSYVKEPKKVKVKDFLLKLRPVQEKKESVQERGNRTKSFFLRMTGLVGSAAKKRKR